MLRSIASTLLLVLCLSQKLQAAEDFPPAGFKEVDSEQSPLGNFKIIHYKRNPEDFSSDAQIWLQALKPDFKTQLLFTYNNRAACVISEDENFIAINHHGGSTDNFLLVFSRGKDGMFHEIKKDFRAAAHKLMTSQLKLKSDPVFDHDNCYADLWLQDGILLGHLSGYYSGEYYLEQWYFIYSAEQDQFSWDLSQINRDAFHLVNHEKAQ